MMKQKDSSIDKSVSEQVLQKLNTIENLLKKKDDHALRQTSKPLTFKEACAYLGYAPSYLYKLTYRKIIPHYKPTGKVIFFSKNEIDEWIFRSRIRQNDGGQAQNSEESSKNKNEDASASLGIADPNQVDMFEKTQDVKEAASKDSAQEKEILIEFPLKSRRKKNVLRD